MQVPERWAPYTFDFVGSSHQLMHIAVAAAALVHFRGLVEACNHIRATDHTCVGLDI